LKDKTAYYSGTAGTGKDQSQSAVGSSEKTTGPTETTG
jgi:hypothetical protein